MHLIHDKKKKPRTVNSFSNIFLNAQIHHIHAKLH